MTTPLVPPTQEQTLALIAERSRGGEADSFTVKIMGRRNGPIASNLATLARARVHHIAGAESWVARLLGGGDYALSVFASGAEHERIGSPISLSIPGQPINEIDTNVVLDPAWDGPPELRFPHPKPVAQTQGTPRPVLNGYGVPSFPAQVAVAPQQQAAQPQTPMDLLAVQRDLESRRASLAQQEWDAKLARERAEAEGRAARERIEMERKFDAALNEVKRKTDEAVAAPSRITETVTAITAALAPIVSALIASNGESKKEAARLASEMAIDARRSQDQMMALIMKMGENKGSSPELTAMLELSKQQASAQGEMMTRMVDAMSTVSKTSVSMIETIAELSAPPEGSPMLDAVKEGVKAMVSLTKGTESGARKIIQTQQALPAQTQHTAAARPPLAPARPPQTRPAPVPQQVRPQAQQQVRQQAQPQAEVMQFAKPTPKPNMPPVVEPGSQGFAGLEEEIPPAAPPINAVEYLEALIREKYEPIDYVAKFFVESLTSQEMIAALEEVDGDPEKLLANRLGPWLLDTENFAYIEKLVEKLEEMNIFEPEDGPGDSVGANP